MTQVVRPPKATQWAYVAGFLDGDGWIAIRARPRPNGRLASDVTIGFVQADAGISALDFVAGVLEAAGIHFTRGRYEQSVKTWAARNQLLVKHRPSVIIMLKQLRRYLVFKKGLASEALMLVQTSMRLRPRQANVPLPKPGRRRYWERREQEALVRLTAAGFNNVAIALHLGRTVHSVAKRRSNMLQGRSHGALANGLSSTRRPAREARMKAGTP